MVMKNTYQIEGMHCAACVAKITGALQGIADQVEVTLNPPSAILTGDVLPDVNALNAAVAKVGGYTLKSVSAAAPVSSDEPRKSWIATYYPLFLIVGLISLASFKEAVTGHDWMLHFMAGFFLVFGFFKMLDLNGFKDAYSTYDLLAKKWPTYGLIYPFLELALGFAFLFQFHLTAALWFSIILMGFSSLGVIKALMEKKKIRCACLGTVLNLPMSTITLVEDLGMVAMSILMLAGMR